MSRSGHSQERPTYKPLLAMTTRKSPEIYNALYNILIKMQGFRVNILILQIFQKINCFLEFLGQRRFDGDESMVWQF